VRATSPAHPCLFAYGGDFPDFLERLPEARSLAYLPHVARLEWAINEAWHAPDAPAVDEDAAARLIAAGFSDLSLRLHPSCRLIASPFPVDRIWRVHQKACSERETVDLDAGGIRLLVHRREDEVGWIDLPPADFAFLDSLVSGSLQKALTFARALDHGFDPTAVLAALIEGGLVSSISPAHGPWEVVTMATTTLSHDVRSGSLIAAVNSARGLLRSRSSPAPVVPTGCVAVSGGSYLAGSPVGVQRARNR